MKKLAVLLFAATLAATLSSPRAGAQLTPTATLVFVQPTDVDPPNLTFTFDGQIRDTDDFENLVTGDYLRDPHNSFPQPGPGIDLHGQIPGPGGFQNINEIDITFNFAGDVTIVPSADFGFTPWTVTELRDASFHHFILTDPGAPINDAFHPNPQNPTFPSFAHVGVDSVTNDPNNTFGSVVFSFQALGVTSPVPEPGALALFGSLGLSAGFGALRLRKRVKK